MANYEYMDIMFPDTTRVQNKERVDIQTVITEMDIYRMEN